MYILIHIYACMQVCIHVGTSKSCHTFFFYLFIFFMIYIFFFTFSLLCCIIIFIWAQWYHYPICSGHFAIKLRSQNVSMYRERYSQGSSGGPKRVKPYSKHFLLALKDGWQEQLWTEIARQKICRVSSLPSPLSLIYINTESTF